MKFIVRLHTKEKIDFIFSPLHYSPTTHTYKMSSYQQQLNKCKDTTDDYSNIWKSKVWTITDYEELFEDIDRGYVIQDPDANYFIINPDWDGEEDSEDDEIKKLCWTCDEKPATHSVFRDALNENELTCDECYTKEYEEDEGIADEYMGSCQNPVKCEEKSCEFYGEKFCCEDIDDHNRDHR